MKWFPQEHGLDAFPKTAVLEIAEKSMRRPDHPPRVALLDPFPRGAKSSREDARIAERFRPRAFVEESISLQDSILGIVYIQQIIGIGESSVMIAAGAEPISVYGRRYQHDPDAAGVRFVGRKNAAAQFTTAP